MPLGVYCCIMGGLQLRHRPLIVSAAWDSALLGIALSGLVAVGPLAAIQPLFRWFTLGRGYLAPCVCTGCCSLYSVCQAAFTYLQHDN